MGFASRHRIRVVRVLQARSSLDARQHQGRRTFSVTTPKFANGYLTVHSISLAGSSVAFFCQPPCRDVFRQSHNQPCGTHTGVRHPAPALLPRAGRPGLVTVVRVVVVRFFLLSSSLFLASECLCGPDITRYHGIYIQPGFCGGMWVISWNTGNPGKMWVRASAYLPMDRVTTMAPRGISPEHPDSAYNGGFGFVPPCPQSPVTRSSASPPKRTLAANTWCRSCKLPDGTRSRIR